MPRPRTVREATRNPEKSMCETCRDCEPVTLLRHDPGHPPGLRRGGPETSFSPTSIGTEFLGLVARYTASEVRRPTGPGSRAASVRHLTEQEYPVGV